MGPNARPAFANLLRNLGTGVLRIGGSSQDVMPFDPTAENTNEVITPEDLADIRATLDAVNADGSGAPRWGVTLGAAMAPPTAGRPWRGPEHARAFVTQGVQPAFAGADEYVAAVSLGDEPDLSYRYDLQQYLSDFAAYSGVTRPYPVVTPNTSEPIASWRSIGDRSVETRFFWDWPAILDATAGPAKAQAGTFGPWAADHFYPLARTCATDPYRCPSIPALLSDERLDNFNYQVYTHAGEAARRGLAYRLSRNSTPPPDAAPPASATSRPARSGRWTRCSTRRAPAAGRPVGQRGVRHGRHRGELPQRGGAGVLPPRGGQRLLQRDRLRPVTGMGAPTPAPEYYALLLFSRFAQGATGLRPVPVTVNDTPGGQVKAWRVDGGRRSAGSSSSTRVTSRCRSTWRRPARRTRSTG